MSEKERKGPAKMIRGPEGGNRPEGDRSVGGEVEKREKEMVPVITRTDDGWRLSGGT